MSRSRAARALEIAGPGLAPGLTLGPEPARALFGRRSPREIEVGDDDFDREVSVQGPPAVALAVLDASTRHVVRTLLRGRFEVPGHRPLWVTGRLDEGVLRVTVPERVPRPSTAARQRGAAASRKRLPRRRSTSFPAVLRAALALAARLVVPKDLAGRLACQPGERAGACRAPTHAATLLREFPGGRSDARGAARGARRRGRGDAPAGWHRARGGGPRATARTRRRRGGQRRDERPSGDRARRLAHVREDEPAAEGRAAHAPAGGGEGVPGPARKPGQRRGRAPGKGPARRKGRARGGGSAGASRDGRSVGRGAARPRARRGTEGAATGGRGGARPRGHARRRLTPARDRGAGCDAAARRAPRGGADPRAARRRGPGAAFARRRRVRPALARPRTSRAA